MEASQIDPVEFRGSQQQSWNKAATGWRRWSDVIDRATGGVSERMVELAGIEPGSRVLDVAAGYGEPSLTAARRAGPDGAVVATDISSEMLAFGRERAGAAGIDTIEFIESDAVSLDFEEQSFDAALSRFGIIFEPDGEGAAARIRGFLTPGGRMAIASWGTPDRVPFLAIPMRTVLERLEVPPPPPGTPGPLSRPTPEALGGLLEAGGFTEVSVEDLAVTFEWQSRDEYRAFIEATAPPITALLATHPQDVRDEVYAAVVEAVAEVGAHGDAVRLTNQVLIATGAA